jgi:hypothetical protein
VSKNKEHRQVRLAQFRGRPHVATDMGQWCSAHRQWVLGSSKAANAARLVVFDLGTNSAISRLLGSAKKSSIWEFSVPCACRSPSTIMILHYTTRTAVSRPFACFFVLFFFT